MNLREQEKEGCAATLSVKMADQSSLKKRKREEAGETQDKDSAANGTPAKKHIKLPAEDGSKARKEGETNDKAAEEEGRLTSAQKRNKRKKRSKKIQEKRKRSRTKNVEKKKRLRQELKEKKELDEEEKAKNVEKQEGHDGNENCSTNGTESAHKEGNHESEKKAEKEKKEEKKEKKEEKKEEEKKEDKENEKAPEKEGDESSVSKLDKALLYLDAWANDKPNWKFQKVRQTFLLQHLYDEQVG